MTLYNVLVESKFNFIKGEQSIDDIYAKVKSTFPTLCDDDLWCSETCRGGHHSPEWMHCVRNALSTLKRSNDVKHVKKEHWVF